MPLKGKGLTRWEKPSTKDMDPCLICREELMEPVKLICNHIFCKICIRLWLRVNETCPYCRAKQQRLACKHFYPPLRLYRPTPPDDCVFCYIYDLGTNEDPIVLTEGPPARLRGRDIYTPENQLQIASEREKEVPEVWWFGKPRTAPLSPAALEERGKLRQMAWNRVPFIKIYNATYRDLMEQNSIFTKVVANEDHPITNGHPDNCMVCGKAMVPADDPKIDRKYILRSAAYPLGVEQSMRVVRLPCNHYFHLKCVARLWSLFNKGHLNLEPRKSCPDCDAPYRVI